MNAIDRTRSGYFTRIARTFSRDWGVTVEVVGHEIAAADYTRKRIVLPGTADFLEGEGRKAVEGFLDHETAHVRAEATFPEGQRPSDAIRIAKAEGGEILNRFRNAFEDVRIEIDASARWPGVRENLDGSMRYAIAAARRKHESSALDPLYLISAGVIAEARGFGSLIEWMPADAIRIVREVLADEVRDAICNDSPMGSVDLARRAIAKIQQEAEKEQNDRGEAPEDQEAGDAGDPDQDSPSPADGADDADGDHGPAGETDLLAGDLPALCGALLASTGAGSMEADLRAAIEQEARTAALATPWRDLPHPAALEADRTIDVAFDRTAFAELAAEAAPVIGGLSMRLAAYLRARGVRRRNDRDHGEIDARAIPEIRAGNSRIFSTLERQDAIDTAVIVLIDQSGSMHGKRERAAGVAAIAIGEAFHRAGVAFAILGWDNNWDQGHPVWDRVSPEDRLLYTRFEGMNLRKYKTFADRWGSARTRLGITVAIGDNDDGPAIRCCARLLLGRRETRKILIVLSDGYPMHLGMVLKDGDATEDQADKKIECGSASLRAAIADVQAAGIEIGAIGIQSDHVREFYPIAEVIREIGDLPRATIDVARRLVATRRTV